MDITFGTKHDVAKIIGFSHDTVNEYRYKFWIEGVHFVRVNSRTTRYNIELVRNWMINRHNPNAHLAAMDEYLRSQSPKRTVGRPRKA